MGQIELSAPAGTPFIDMAREFDAPRDLVYRAWTDPELVVQWLGPRKYEMVIDHWDARDGGSYRYLHRDDQGNEHGFHGVFHSLAPQQMVQTFEYDGAPGHVSLDSLNLEERDGRTLMRARSVHQSIEARDAMVASGMEGGLSEGFERLDALLTGLVPAAR
jgi:uncharacterized protein YndB with AHSA1/START domain